MSKELPLPLKSAEIGRLQRELGAWYRANQRDLPWRRTRDPYAIWISEAMLQQTRVETVKDYWVRFLERFPTVESLANGPEEDVLAAWSGLGYYRRARSLQAAARALVERHGGSFPRTREEAEDLPGVGPYTAGAVLSIAYDLPEALVDGNVERVFARLFDLDLELAALKRLAWRWGPRLMPPVPAGGANSGADELPTPGEWNQALMELGATVCTPREPSCLLCPLSARCAARAAGTWAERPRRAVKTPPVEVELELAWVRRGDKLLLEQRPPDGRMAGLWQLPTREVSDSGLFPSKWEAGIDLESGEPGEELLQLRHGITRHRILGRVWLGRLRGRVVAPLAWFEPAQLENTGLTGMTKKTLARLL